LQHQVRTFSVQLGDITRSTVLDASSVDAVAAAAANDDVSATPGPVTKPKAGHKTFASVTAGNIPQAALGKVVYAASAQLREDELHRNSIVIEGLAEDHDKVKVANLIKQLDPSAEFVECYRMGLFNEPPWYKFKRRGPRPIKVTFPSSTVAKSVLNSAFQLRQMPGYENVFIRRSMSLEERQQLFSERRQYHNLRTECRHYNEGFSPDARIKFVIKNGGILKYVNCILNDDNTLGRGTLDNTFKYKKP